MRTFQDLLNTYPLKKFLDSPKGTLYFIPLQEEGPSIIVRHFDQDWSPNLIPAFTSIVQECQAWIAMDPVLNLLVRAEQIIEKGQDFVSRTHHYYHVSLDNYDAGKVDSPPALKIVRNRIRQKEKNPVGDKGAFIQRVMNNTLLQANSKVFWEDEEERFVIVEPSIKKDWLEQWT